MTIGPTSTSEHLMHELADHLHEHCRCDSAAGAPQCDACDLRAELRTAREQMLAWQARGRRLRQQCDDAVANALGLVRRSSSSCGACAGLSGLHGALGAAATERGA